MNSMVGTSRLRALAYGGLVGASLGVIEVSVRALLPGSMRWQPADPTWEILTAGLWSAALYALPGMVIGFLAAPWWPRVPRPRPALALAPALALVTTVVAILASTAPGPSPARAAAPAGAPSLLLVSLDTLRIDALGAYGNATARTPTIDALAREGVRFADATVQSILTGPSHVSILSGRTPPSHGVTENLDPLGEGVPTLADGLTGAGWQTGAFVAGYPLKERSLQLLRRFETRDDDFRAWRGAPYLAYETYLGRLAARLHTRFSGPLDPPRRPAHAVTDQALEWLEEPDPRPFFAWVHYFDAHLPYEPPERFLSPADRAYSGPADGRWYQIDEARRAKIRASPEAVAHMRALYDASVASIDEELARLVRAARARAGAAGLYIVLTSDHGESFGEHDIWYERDLYEDCLRVPLIIVPPKGLAPGRVVDESVRSIDIAPTLHEALGVPPDGVVEGRSLLPWLESKPTPLQVASLAAIYPSRGGRRKNMRLSFREGGWKAVWDFSLTERTDSDPQLFHLPDDPAELHNLAPADPTRFEGMRTRMDPRVIEAGLPDTELSGEELEILRSLGYAR